MGLTITDLTKRYGRTTALDHMSLDLRPGTIYGLFGRNGAGKSTLLGCLSNRLIPASGRIELDGEVLLENEPAMARIYLADNRWPWTNFALSKVFDDYGRMYDGFDRELAEAMCHRLGLSTDASYGRLSFGQRTLACMMIGLCLPVDYLFLDEPTTGLDPVNRRILVGFLLEAYVRRPRAIVVSTHEIDEFASVVERAVIIDRGRRIDEFAVEDLHRRAVLLSGPRDVVEVFAASRGLHVVDIEPGAGSVSILAVINGTSAETGASVKAGVSARPDTSSVSDANDWSDVDLSSVVSDLPDGVHARTPDLQTYFVRLMQGRH